MAHQIENRDSQTGTEMAWHGLTNVVDQVNEDNCGILYELTKTPLHLPDGAVVPGAYIAVAGDDGLPVGGPVGERYTLIGNREIWEAVQESLSYTEHQIVSVGSVGNRERGFISVKLDAEFVAAERRTQSVLNILWGHGGCMGVIAKTGLTVTVCRNTFNMAMSERGDFNFKVRHTGDAAPKLTNMKQAVAAHVRATSEFIQVMETMNGTRITSQDAKRFFAGFVAGDRSEDAGPLSTRSKNQIDAMDRLFYTGLGNGGQTVADLFNAVTDFYSHESAGGQDNPWRQFESSEFGTGAQRKTAAYQVLSGGKAAGLGDLSEVLKRGFALVG